jgi:hypothetical protein
MDDAGACCQACFLLESSNVNQVVYCEECELGTHELCYGYKVDDLTDFCCQKCIDYKNDLKVRLPLMKD